MGILQSQRYCKLSTDVYVMCRYCLETMLWGYPLLFYCFIKMSYSIFLTTYQYVCNTGCYLELHQWALSTERFQRKVLDRSSSF